MRHTFAGNYVHCVFSTKQRRNIISAAMQSKLRGYMSGVAKNLKVDVVATGGTANHVHLLLSIPTTHRISEVVQKIKANSSRWMNLHERGFDWQKGYGAFSVSPSLVGTVKAYVLNQEEHHRQRSFEEEFAALLRKSGIEFSAEELFADTPD